jgi:hypothetical protein
VLTRLVPTLVAAFLLVTASASAAAPQPVVEGDSIIDSVTGKVFVPHGVNFPGYEYTCQQGHGYGEDGTEPGEMASTVAAMADWKINTVRLPLNQDCWLGDDGLPAGGLTVNGYRNSVEDFVNMLGTFGIVAILDLHWSGPNGVVANGLRPMPDDRTPAFWNSVASRFRENRSVIFDLFNEPHSRWNIDDVKVFGLSWDCWANGGCLAPSEPDTVDFSGLLPRYRTVGLKTLLNVVRAAGATQPILLSGTDYANDLRGWLASAPKDDQLIAGFHNYLVQRCRTVRCWDEEIEPLSRKVPVLTAEIGQNDCGRPDHLNRFMNWADERRIGYLVWAWWDLPKLGCTNFALVSDLVDGTPLPPVGTAFHDHLASLPDTLPEPPRPVNPGISFRSAWWNGRILGIEVKINRQVSTRLRVNVRLSRDRRSKIPPRTTSRKMIREIRVMSGVATTRFRIPRGLKPVLVTASYPGDRLFKAASVKRKPSSVRKLTR